jgi:hypothetical protein
LYADAESRTIHVVKASWLACALLGATLPLLPIACGSRTGLLLGERVPGDAAGEPDASIDVFEDVAFDSGPQGFDVPPPPSECPDAGSTFIYLVSESRELYSFYPPAASFHDIGHIGCPTTYQAFSMAVDRAGTAYVLLSDIGMPAQGTLWRVSTGDAACSPIPQYVAGQDGFQVYGMGFAANGDAGDAGETLYLGGGGYFGSSTGLASLDTTNFQLHYIGQNNPPPQAMELTGTGDGRLFGLVFYDATGTTFYIAQVDPSSGAVLSQMQVTATNVGGGFSIAYWGGDFYLFTAPGGDTFVTRYRPSDGSYTTVAQLPGVTIVGAGVSTCAPM